MTKCTRGCFTFPAVKCRQVETDFPVATSPVMAVCCCCGRLTSAWGLLKAVDAVLSDPRDGRYVVHDQLTLLRQRIYALCRGYEDLNDHDSLRGNLALQTAVEQDRMLGSSPTLCRLENRIDREAAMAIHQVLVEQFIASFAEPPE